MLFSKDTINQLILYKKILREIYTMIESLGDRMNINYEGEFKRQGDTVQMRIEPKALDGRSLSYRPLIIDKEIPPDDKIAFILNTVNWEKEGDIVITCTNDGRFFMGYNEVN